MSLQLDHMHVTRNMLLVVEGVDCEGTDLLKVQGFDGWDLTGTTVRGFLLWAGIEAAYFLPANQKFEVFA